MEEDKNTIIVHSHGKPVMVLAATSITFLSGDKDKPVGTLDWSSGKLVFEGAGDPSLEALHIVTKELSGYINRTFEGDAK